MCEYCEAKGTNPGEWKYGKPFYSIGKSLQAYIDDKNRLVIIDSKSGFGGFGEYLGSFELPFCLHCTRQLEQTGQSEYFGGLNKNQAQRFYIGKCILQMSGCELGDFVKALDKEENCPNITFSGSYDDDTELFMLYAGEENCVYIYGGYEEFMEKFLPEVKESANIYKLFSRLGISMEQAIFEHEKGERQLIFDECPAA